jgi:hypothetical protein
MKRDACVLACVGFAAAVGYAQQPQAPIVKATTAGVLMDVTVLDNKGQPVLDLAPADFEVKEEGKLQQVLSVTLVQNGIAQTAGGGSAVVPSQSAQPQQPNPPALGATASATATATDTTYRPAFPIER